MLEDKECEALHELMSELNDYGITPDEDAVKDARAALGKLLQLEAWLSSPKFRIALAATIKDSAHAVLDQRRMHGIESTWTLWDQISREIGNNAAATTLFLILEPPTGDGT